MNTTTTSVASEHPGFAAVVDDCIDDVWHLSRRLMPDEDTAVVALLRTFLRSRRALAEAGPLVSPRAVVLEICAGVCREYRLTQAAAQTRAIPASSVRRS